MTEQQRVRMSLGAGGVDVVAPPGMVARCAELGRPFLRTAGREPGEGDTPTVLALRSAPPWRRVVYPSAYEPDRILWVDDERRRIAVAGEASEWQTQQLFRAVRHVLRWQAYAAGELLLHGGLVRMGGKGIAFIGGKRSGKTSSILSALVHGPADFVSNDDVAITDTSDDGLTAYGSPRTVNVRTDALLALARSAPAVLGLLRNPSHPTNRYEGRHTAEEAIHTDGGSRLSGSLWIRPAELARATGCGLLPAHRVDAVVLPRFRGPADRPGLRRLDSRTARAALAEHVETQGTKYDPFLADWFPETARARRDRIQDRLLQEAAFYAATQEMDRLGEMTKLLADSVRP